MKPTIGRIVHYQRKGAEGGKAPPPLAAIVTSIEADGSAGLAVLAGNFVFHEICAQAPNDVPTPGHWNWPPRA